MILLVWLLLAGLIVSNLGNLMRCFDASESKENSSNSWLVGLWIIMIVVVFYVYALWKTDRFILFPLLTNSEVSKLFDSSSDNCNHKDMRCESYSENNVKNKESDHVLTSEVVHKDRGWEVKEDCSCSYHR